MNATDIYKGIINLLNNFGMHISNLLGECRGVFWMSNVHDVKKGEQISPNDNLSTANGGPGCSPRPSQTLTPHTIYTVPLEPVRRCLRARRLSRCHDIFQPPALRDPAVPDAPATRLQPGACEQAYPAVHCSRERALEHCCKLLAHKSCLYRTSELFLS